MVSVYSGRPYPKTAETGGKGKSVRGAVHQRWQSENKRGGQGKEWGITGLVNFSNTCIAVILARSREMTMLQSIGMTKERQMRMLMLEGSIYWNACGMVNRKIELY